MEVAFSGSSGASRDSTLDDVCQAHRLVIRPPLGGAHDGIAETTVSFVALVKPVVRSNDDGFRAIVSNHIDAAVVIVSKH